MPDPPDAASRGESLPRDERLRRRADILKCYQRGRRRHGSLVILYIHEREAEAEHPRLGISVSRKVGGAVVRYRVKRRIREIYRRWNKRPTLPPLDILVHVKPKAGTAAFQELKDEILGLLGPLSRRRSTAS